MGEKRNYYDLLDSSSSVRHPSVDRAEAVDYELPFRSLDARLQVNIPNVTTKNVMHWFRTKDLRIEDNRGLSKAAKLAQTHNTRVYTLFVVNPKELQSHGVGESRKRFMVNHIKYLNNQLKALNIPLIPIIAGTNREIVERIMELCNDLDVNHITANFEYEYDEVKRDMYCLDVFKRSDILFSLEHDQTVVVPGSVLNTNGAPKKVFTHFWHSWVDITKKDPKMYTELCDPIEKQPEFTQDKEAAATESAATEPTTTDLFQLMDDVNFDEVLDIKGVIVESSQWPVGHDAAIERLKTFLDRKIAKYFELRSVPAADCTSRLSPYFALGVISVREVLKITRERANNDKPFGLSESGVDQWVRELVFREFYRQMVCIAVPHIVMNTPGNLNLANIPTDYDEPSWKDWCNGRTGYPFVDAGMRQLKYEGYMHNRVRMVVASFLKMTMLFDYRLGMSFFANKLLDWDCCNNCFGWDPSNTVFNPLLQAKKFDPEGIYIRKWVPELRDLPTKIIFNPEAALNRVDFKKLMYASPIRTLDVTKTEALERYKGCFKKRKTD